MLLSFVFFANTVWELYRTLKWEFYDTLIWELYGTLIWELYDTLIWELCDTLIALIHWYGSSMMRWYGSSIKRWYGSSMIRWYGRHTDMGTLWCAGMGALWHTDMLIDRMLHFVTHSVWRSLDNFIRAGSFPPLPYLHLLWLEWSCVLRRELPAHSPMHASLKVERMCFRLYVPLWRVFSWCLF